MREISGYREHTCINDHGKNITSGRAGSPDVVRQSSKSYMSDRMDEAYLPFVVSMEGSEKTG
jgi:hypothetical protein